MRKLTKREEEAMSQARTDLMDGCEYDKFTQTLISATYRQAWKDCLNYTQAKLDAYAAYVAGKITLEELEEVVNV